MAILEATQYLGGVNFLEDFLNDVEVVQYSDHKVILRHDGEKDIVAIIKGHDFAFENGVMTGGQFKSIKIFEVDECGAHKLLLNAHVTGKGIVSVLDVLQGNIGIHLNAAFADSSVVYNGTFSDDSLLGSLLDDFLDGEDGDDFLDGSDGLDELFGGNGLDVLLGGKGNDKLHGGSGKDKLKGGSGRDELNGDSGSDELQGGNGHDALNGGDDNDYLNGGADNDRLDGGRDNDNLFGGSGNDIVSGGKGNDKLWGEKGHDSFVFARGFDKDKVLDFRDDVDTILLNDNLWNGKMSVKKLLNKFGEETHNGVVLDFGQGDILKIAGVEDLRDLRNDIEII